MLKTCLLLCCVSCARGSGPAGGRPGALGPAALAATGASDPAALAATGVSDPAARASGPAALVAAGRARAALCLRGAACEGALWAPRWLLARASCLRGHRLAGARVLPHRDITHCNNITEAMSPIGVLEPYYEHPAFRDAWTGAVRCDAALVQLATPAPASAAPAGDSARVATAVPELAAWLQWVLAQAAAAREEAAAPPRPPHWRVASTPLRLLAATVLLPLASLLLLFVLALRVSWGQPDDVPYDALEGSKEPDPLAPALSQPEAGDFGDILPMSLPL